MNGFTRYVHSAHDCRIYLTRRKRPDSKLKTPYAGEFFR